MSKKATKQVAKKGNKKYSAEDYWEYVEKHPYIQEEATESLSPLAWGAQMLELDFKFQLYEVARYCGSNQITERDIVEFILNSYIDELEVIVSRPWDDDYSGYDDIIQVGDVVELQSV